MAGRAAEKELKRLKAIIRVLRSIGANPELEEICRIAVRELINILGCDGCAAILTEGDKVRILAERGFAEAFGKIEVNADIPLIKYIVDTRQAIFSTDVRSSPASSYIPHGTSINSLICTPIIAKNDVRGIIYVDSMKKHAFDEEDMEFTRLLATEVSMALERSFQYPQVRYTSIRDKLTGCLNRRRFDLDIVAEIASAKEYEKQVSLLMVDIDGFKRYNDFHGHRKGNKLLKKIVYILTYNIRPYDKVYRYGGEEFAILMPDTDKEQASITARRLQKVIEKEEFEGERESQPNRRITISIGVATYPSDADHRDKLIGSADSALCRAKESGGNQVRV